MVQRPCSGWPRDSDAGFTIVELMIVVVILGVLTSLAVPGFVSFVRTSRTAEIPPNLKAMFTSAASYYRLELTGEGTNATSVTNCISGPGKSDWAPSSDKHAWLPVSGAGFGTIGFYVADKVYFNYEIDTFGLPSTCVMPELNPNTYVMRAQGDLDDDGILSTFELAVGTDADNALYRGVGIWADKPLE